MQIHLKCPNESFMGQPRENGTSHSVTLLHNVPCLHRIDESQNQCIEVLTNCCRGYHAHFHVPCRKSLCSWFCFVSSTCFLWADSLWKWELVWSCNLPISNLVWWSPVFTGIRKTAMVQNSSAKLWQFIGVTKHYCVSFHVCKPHTVEFFLWDNYPSHHW